MDNIICLHYMPKSRQLYCYKQQMNRNGIWVASKPFLQADLNNNELDRIVLNYLERDCLLLDKSDEFSVAIFKEFLQLTGSKNESKLIKDSICVLIYKDECGKVYAQHFIPDADGGSISDRQKKHLLYDNNSIRYNISKLLVDIVNT